MAARKKQLHQPPHEFAVANKARRGWDWILKREREAARSERDRERVMPSHPKPKPFERFCAKGSSGRHTSKDPLWGYYEYNPKCRVKHINV